MRIVYVFLFSRTEMNTEEEYCQDAQSIDKCYCVLEGSVQSVADAVARLSREEVSQKLCLDDLYCELEQEEEKGGSEESHEVDETEIDHLESNKKPLSLLSN